MKALLKGIIIAIITVGVVVPAGYFSLIVYHNESTSLTQLIPQDSSMVVRTDYNGTPIYAYNYSNTDGLVIGISLTGFSTELSSTANQTNGTHAMISPTLFTTYRGYSIYELKNVTFQGLIPSEFQFLSFGYNYSLNVSNYVSNDTVYVAELTGIVTIGPYQAVRYSLDALLDNVNFETRASSFFNNSANVSIYFSSTNLPVRQAVSNIYYLSSNFNLEMSNVTNAQQINKGLSAVNLLATNFTFLSSSQMQGTWVNGTIGVGIGNYYLLQGLMDSLSKLNYTQYLTGFKP